MLELFAQEPRFETTDKEILEACGIKILETPEAQNMIDTNTFVMAPVWSWGLAFEITGAPIEAQPGRLLAGDYEGLAERSPDCLRMRSSKCPDNPYSCAELADYSEGQDAREMQICHQSFLDAKDNYERFPGCTNDRTCGFSGAHEIGRHLESATSICMFRKEAQEKDSFVVTFSPGTVVLRSLSASSTS